MKETLQPKFGLFTSLAMVIGTVVGIGIYFKAAPVLANTGGSEAYALTAWIGGAAIAIIAGLVVAELASMTHNTGGLQSFAEQTWGKGFGFIVGWTQTVLYVPLILSILAFYAATFTLMFLNWEISILNLMVFTFGYYIAVNVVNIISAVAGGRLQQIMTVLKLIPLFGIALFGFFYSGDTSTALKLSGAAVQPTSAFSAISTAMIPVLFAFEGWIFATTVAREIKNPQRNLPIAIVGGIIVISIVYVVFTIGLLHIAPGSEYAYNSGEVNVFSASTILFGDMGGKIIQGFIVISALGVLNAYTLFSMRMPYSLAMRNHFPGAASLRYISPTSNVPTKSALLIGGWTLLIMAIGFALYASGQVGVFDIFGDIPVALFYIFYLIIFIGVLRLRKTHPHVPRPFKVPFLPLFVVLAVLGSAYAVYGAFLSHPYYMIGCIAVALIGLIAYTQAEEVMQTSGLGETA